MINEDIHTSTLMADNESETKSTVLYCMEQLIKLKHKIFCTISIIAYANCKHITDIKFVMSEELSTGKQLAKPNYLQPNARCSM